MNSSGNNKIVCCVTNDLNQDQRMHRICQVLHQQGLKTTLTGRTKKNSLPLLNRTFSQFRIPCRFQHGPAFYLEYNIRLLSYLLRSEADIIYSVDYDTLPACTLAAIVKRKKLVLDAHEYFTEVPELRDKKVKKFLWNLVAKVCIPFCDVCITVNKSLADIFSKLFHKNFHFIYNVTETKVNVNLKSRVFPKKPFTLLYQGMLNEGRGLESLIDAMPLLTDCELWLAGEGDLSILLRKQTEKSSAHARIHFLGWQNHDQLQNLTSKADVGLNLLSAESFSYYYSLANKFFDYMHAGVPSVNMDFPEYAKILKEFKTGVLLKDLSAESIANTIQNLFADEEAYKQMQKECIKAAEVYNWEKESRKLIEIINPLMYKPGI